MTTKITVTSHNYPAHVETIDLAKVGDDVIATVVHERILWPDDGEQVFYCTTSRIIRVTDIDYDDPRALASRPRDPG